MDTEQRIEKLEIKIDENNKEYWTTFDKIRDLVGKNATQIAVTQKSLENILENLGKIAQPCSHGTQLKRDLDNHLAEHKKEENDKKRMWGLFWMKLLGGAVSFVILSVLSHLIFTSIKADYKKDVTNEKPIVQKMP